MQQMYSCPNCGSMVEYGQKFCANCGASFDWGGVQDNSQSSSDYDYQQQSDQQWGQQYDQQYDQQQWSQQQNWGQQPGWNQGYSNQQQAFGKQFRQPPRPGARRTTPAKGLSNRMLMGIIVALAVIFVGGGIFLVAGGDILGGKKVADNTPAVVTKPVVTFSVNPTSITTGQSANLSWEATGATTVTIDNNIGSVAASGTRTVTPSASTSYTLTATNSAGTVTASAALIVNAGGTPQIVSFVANPTSVSAGGQTPSTLSWEVKGATSITIDNAIGGVEASGSKSVVPTTTTTYTMTATNSNGSTTAAATVTVLASNTPVIASFTANPGTITSGQEVTLQWSISGATTATLDGTSVNATSGTKTVTPSSNTTYTLVATNSAGSTTQKATVTITTSSTLPVITSFTSSPMTIIAGSGSTSSLQWTISGASSVSIDNSVGSVTPLTSGSTPVAPETTTTYIITATNTKGSVTAAATVTVVPEGSPAIVYFTASPSSISSGQSVTLNWNISDATSVTIDHGVGSVSPTSGSVTMTPTSTTTYTLTALNDVGPVSATARVTVASGVQFTATPSTIYSGQSTTLHWYILGVSSVTIEPGGITGSGGPADVEVAPATTTTYNLTAGSITASVTVTVLAANAPQIISFEANPATLAAGGGTTTLSWNISGATSVSISPGNPTIPSTTSGTVEMTVTGTTTYTITAANSQGTVTDSVTVTVSPP